MKMLTLAFLMSLAAASSVLAQTVPPPQPGTVIFNPRPGSTYGGPQTPTCIVMQTRIICRNAQ